jgi:hypothetical protein
MPTLSAPALCSFVRDIYAAHGLSPEAAQTLAEVQV